MLIGLTYDLRSDYLREGYSEIETAEFDRDDTISVIDETLLKLGYETERIGHVRSLVGMLCAGKRWDMVFNICEGMHGMGREAQVPALLDAYKIPYVFSDTVTLAITLDKALTKRIVRDAGFATPDFYLVKNPGDIEKIAIPFPLFAKPNGEGTGKGIGADSIIFDAQQLQKVVTRLLDEFKQPVLVEKYLPGREFTAAILGTGSKARVLGVMEVLLNEQAEQNVYSYHNKENSEDLVGYWMLDDELGKACEQLALGVWNLFGCRDAGRLDIRLDEKGVPNFIEINPLAGIHYGHSDLPIIASMRNMDFSQLLEIIMNSAKERI